MSADAHPGEVAASPEGCPWFERAAPRVEFDPGRMRWTFGNERVKRSVEYADGGFRAVEFRDTASGRSHQAAAPGSPEGIIKVAGAPPTDRFDPMPPLYDAAPKGQHPRDFVPEARSMISFAMPILGPVLGAPAVLAESDLETIRRGRA